MTVATQQGSRGSGSYLSRPQPSGLADVVELILDKGLVIDAYVRVSLVGIEILTVDARIVVASVDTYLRFAEATNRLDLHEKGGKDLSEMMGDTTQETAEGKSQGLIEGAKDALTGGDDDDEQKSGSQRRSSESSSRKEPARRRRSSSSSSSS